MSEEVTLESLTGHTLSRRSVVHAAAWTAPAVLIAHMGPAAAASGETAATISLSNVSVSPNATTGLLSAGASIQVAQGTAEDFVMFLTLPDTAEFVEVASPWVAGTPSAISGGRTQFMFVLSGSVTGPNYVTPLVATFNIDGLVDYTVRFKAQAQSAGATITSATVNVTVSATDE